MTCHLVTDIIILVNLTLTKLHENFIKKIRYYTPCLRK